MKKSINLYFTNNKLEKEKLVQIKNQGFDEFFTDIYDDGEDLTLAEQINFGKKLGLNCTMIHCLYDEPKLHYFWEKGEKGDEVCNEYCRQIKMSKGLADNFVIHLNAKKDQKFSRFGLDRIKTLLSVCDQCEINLCVENLYSEKEIPYIFKHIKHPRLKICFDIGHQNFLTPNFDLLKKYGNFVSVLHMHDNNGLADEHLICGNGSIDWKKVAKNLKLVSNIVLSAEIKDKNQDYKQTLKEVYQSLCMIEQLMG